MAGPELGKEKEEMVKVRDWLARKGIVGHEP